MENNEKMLDELYKNTQMGTYAIDCVKPKIKSKELIDLLVKQNNYYREINTKINKISKSLNYEPKNLCVGIRVMSYLSIKTKLLFNNKTNYISNMLVEGTQMGIENTGKALSKYSDCDGSIKELANNLIKTQTDFIASLNKFSAIQ